MELELRSAYFFRGLCCDDHSPCHEGGGVSSTKQVTSKTVKGGMGGW